MAGVEKADEKEIISGGSQPDNNHIHVLEGEELGSNRNLESISTDTNKIAFKVPAFNLKPPLKVLSGESETFHHKSTVKSVETVCQNKETVQHKTSKLKGGKVSHLSPAELLKQSEIPIPYKEPPWGGCCKEIYSFEVIKNGTVLNTIDLNTKSFFVFGRLPSCDVSMDHPSLSRHHAVVQFCSLQSETREKGWYLYDLDSTHGTWINKNKVKSRKYHRLRVGFVLKFGGSSRLHILQGPSDDEDTESDLSVTEIKQQHERQKKEVELLRHAKQIELEENQKVVEKSSGEGCSWGIDDDAIEIDSTNPFALEVPLNEDLYIDDPKKSLRGYFEREGLDLPEYEVEDMERGKYKCTVELPVDNEMTGEPIVAEVTVTGKKKDAVAACALEACRILDKMGELRKSNHESRKRKAKNWEENDFYDSDDDTFLDRTGDIEKKRQQRMQRLGKNKEKVVETYDSIILKLETIEKEMAEIQQKLDEAKAQADAVEAEDGLDALDMFMANIKSGAMDTKTRMSLKRKLFDLKQEQIKLQKLANIAKPAHIPDPIPKKPLATTIKGTSLPVFGKMKTNTQKLHPMVSPQPKNNVQNMETEFKEEEDEDEEEEKTPTDNKTVNKTIVEPEHSMETEIASSSDNFGCSIKDDTGKLENITQNNEIQSHTEDKISETKELNNLSTQQIDTSDQMLDKKIENVDHLTKGPSVLPSDEFEKAPSQKQSSRKRVRVRKKKCTKSDDNDGFHPDYAAWLPPEDQSGDGKTSLNEKFGY